MLTIKHVESGGHESLCTAREMSFQRGTPPPENIRDRVIAFGVPGPDEGARNGGVLEFDCGRVFVMNDNGKTVAVYDLGEHESADPK